MKIVKKILIGLVALIAIVLIVALFVEKDYSVEREIVINKPSPAVFSYVKQIKNQDHFSKWNMADPGMKKTYKGTDAAVGFIYAWEGNSDVGKGEQEIKRIEEGKRIDMDLRFIEPMEATAQAYITTDAVNQTQTKVKWGMKSSMPYPFNIMRVFMSIEDMLGKDIETGLTNLKSNLQKQ